MPALRLVQPGQALCNAQRPRFHVQCKGQFQGIAIAALGFQLRTCSARQHEFAFAPVKLGLEVPFVVRRLLVVEAGTGRLLAVDLATGEIAVLAEGLAAAPGGQGGIPPLLSGVAVGPSGAIYAAGGGENALYRISSKLELPPERQAVGQQAPLVTSVDDVAGDWLQDACKDRTAALDGATLKQAQ